MTESAEHRIETAHVRRSPRYAIFFAVGAGLGILAALILTFAFEGGKSAATQVTYSDSQVFGFLCLVCIPVGLAIGGGIALLLERRMSRRTREVRIDHERVTLDTPDTPDA